MDVRRCFPTPYLFLPPESLLRITSRHLWVRFHSQSPAPTPALAAASLHHEARGHRGRCSSRCYRHRGCGYCSRVKSGALKAAGLSPCASVLEPALSPSRAVPHRACDNRQCPQTPADYADGRYFHHCQSSPVQGQKPECVAWRDFLLEFTQI